MIETLVPGAACAELFGDALQAALLPVEAAAVAGAVEQRQREFGSVRHCAREALRSLGLPAVAILSDADGAPRWPDGVVGSMTHCGGYRAAVVARTENLRGVGIDAEPHAALPADVRELVLADDVVEEGADPHWDRVVFCAKEAVYKAWFPLTRRWLDFADVATTVRADGTFDARAKGCCFSGRWLVERGLIVAATEVPA